MLRITLPKIPLAVLLTVLACIVTTMVSTAPKVWAQTHASAITNEREHSDILREVDKLGGRLGAVEKYLGEVQDSKLTERMARSETTLDMIVKMMWMMLAGLGTLIGNAAHEKFKARKLR